MSSRVQTHALTYQAAGRQLVGKRVVGNLQAVGGHMLVLVVDMRRVVGGRRPVRGADTRQVRGDGPREAGRLRAGDAPQEVGNARAAHL